jgi:hypothetical protein
MSGKHEATAANRKTITPALSIADDFNAMPRIPSNIAASIPPPQSIKRILLGLIFIVVFVRS